MARIETWRYFLLRLGFSAHSELSSSMSFPKVAYNCQLYHSTGIVKLSNFTPRAGSGVVRIDPLRFLAGCRKSD